VTNVLSPSAPPGESLADWTHASLSWNQLGMLRREWEWRADERVIGRLRLEGLVRPKPIAEGPSGPWTIQMAWTGHAEIRDTKARVVASYRPGWWGNGTIGTLSNERLRWKRRGLMRPTWTIETESGTACLTFRAKRSFVRYEATVEISDFGRRLEQLEALMLLGWHLYVAAERVHHYST
jgi:hypothetical protein